MYKYKKVYPKEYKGLGKCHSRALRNVHEAATREALKGKTCHTAADEVHEVAKRHEKGHGRVFRIRNEHWVALTRKATGSVEGFYYDDIVMMEVNHYDGALAVLELLETMTLAQYEAVFLGGGSAKKTRRAAPQEDVSAALVTSPQMTDFLLDHCTCKAMYTPPHLLHGSS